MGEGMLLGEEMDGEMNSAAPGVGSSAIAQAEAISDATFIAEDAELEEGMAIQSKSYTVYQSTTGNYYGMTSRFQARAAEQLFKLKIKVEPVLSGGLSWFLTMKQRIKIGDVVEIQTRKGKTYAQFFQYHSAPPNYGSLLRILPGFFSQRPTDFNGLTAKKETFSTFFPVQAAVNRGLVQIVANVVVPIYAQPFPVFRTGIRNPATGKVAQWRLWNGKKEWKIGNLTDAELDLPILSIPSYPMLVDDIEEGWTPRRDEEFTDRARAKLAQTKASDEPKVVEEVRHYLIFKHHDSAEEAAVRIRALNLQAGVTDLGESWGVNVLQQKLADDATQNLAGRLQEIASTAGGIYDGIQVKVVSKT